MHPAGDHTFWSSKCQDKEHDTSFLAEHASLPSPQTANHPLAFFDKCCVWRADGVAESRKALNTIMQQIKDIAKLPQEIRSSQLHALTLEAFQAASKQTDSPIAAELLRLASFACPHTEAALKQRIELALKDPEGAAKAGAHRSESTEQPLVSTTRQQGCVQPQKSAAGTKVDAAAANEKFVAAKQLIRR